MNIAITGSKGVVGSALIANIDQGEFNITSLDLPEHDAGDYDDLLQATKGSDVLIHLAWDLANDNPGIEEMDVNNDQMLFNAYRAAVANNIKRVIMASSNHAHSHDLHDKDGRITASIEPPVPDSPYGAEKVFMEALGRYYAKNHGLEVICIRIGNVNKDNKPRDNENPRRWLSHADLGRLITCCLEAKTVPNNFQLIYGVSKQDVFDWSNPFGYEPGD